MKNILLSLISLSMLIFLFSCSTEQQNSNDQGKNAIPYPLPEWDGVQGKTLADSKPDFIGQPQAPEGAPNVLIIMLDDGGYSNAMSYGGVMRTPTFDQIGAEGIRYTHMEAGHASKNIFLQAAALKVITPRSKVRWPQCLTNAQS